MLTTFIEEDFIGYFKDYEEANINLYNDIKSKTNQLFHVCGLVLVSALNIQVLL
jgi:hypothetical protein